VAQVADLEAALGRPGALRAECFGTQREQMRALAEGLQRSSLQRTAFEAAARAWQVALAELANEVGFSV
jgi:hypothetical protein